MPRAATTSDVFNAIAERRRRKIIDLLADGRQWPVSDLVQRLRMPQPAVSKHLGVLRSVRVVSVTRRGRVRLYRLNPAELKAVHDWTSHFEQFWSNQVDRIKARAEAVAKARSLQQNENPPQPKEPS